MKVPWKVVGLAGLAGVAATGAVVARNRRQQEDYDPDELRVEAPRPARRGGRDRRAGGAEARGLAVDDVGDDHGHVVARPVR